MAGLESTIQVNLNGHTFDSSHFHFQRTASSIFDLYLHTVLLITSVKLNPLFKWNGSVGRTNNLSAYESHAKRQAERS